MCGRYASFRQADDLAALFDIEDVQSDAAERPASWNVSPGQDVRIVAERIVDEHPHRILALAHWGFVPAWASDPATARGWINARSETAATSRAFSSAANRRRCLVPADAYYEWSHPKGVRAQPYAFADPHGEPLALAGIYEAWRPRGGGSDETSPRVSMAILTRQATGDLAAIHDRCPLILPASAWGHWLDPTVDAAAVADLWQCPPPALTITEISPAVNSPRHDGPELLTPSNAR